MGNIGDQLLLQAIRLGELHSGVGQGIGQLHRFLVTAHAEIHVVPSPCHTLSGFVHVPQGSGEVPRDQNGQDHSTHQGKDGNGAKLDLKGFHGGIQRGELGIEQDDIQLSMLSLDHANTNEAHAVLFRSLHLITGKESLRPGDQGIGFRAVQGLGGEPQGAGSAVGVRLPVQVRQVFV